VTKYSKFYETASEECCLFIIPRNKYLKLVNINENFIINHILKPSKLLKSHYTPFKKCSIVDVEVENDHLLVQYSDGEKNYEKIKIIDEEIAYNAKNKSYRILIVEQPLIKLKINPSRLKEEPLQTIYFTFEECQSYLGALSSDILKEIELKVETFLKTYLILPDYLDEAAIKIQGLIEWAYDRYSKGRAAHIDNDEVLVSSLECYILALASDQLYPVIKSHCLSEEQELIEQIKRMEKEDIHFVNIGSNQIFRTYEPSKQIYGLLQAILKKISY